jgi:Protein of unknown function (DUF3617)
LAYRCCTLILLILTPTAASLATTPLNVKPGLWETTVQQESSGMPPIPQAALDKLPPEQRARLETMIQARAAGGPHTSSRVERSCLTRAELEQPFMPDENKHCTHRVVSSTGSKMEIEAQCAQDGAVKSAMSMRFEASSPEHVAGIITVTAESTTPGDGHTMTIKNHMDARWLGADCGDVKPVSPPKAH